MHGWEASALGRSDQAECSRPDRTVGTAGEVRIPSPARPDRTGSSVLLGSVKRRGHLCQSSPLPE